MFLRYSKSTEVQNTFSVIFDVFCCLSNSRYSGRYSNHKEIILFIFNNKYKKGFFCRWLRECAFRNGFRSLHYHFRLFLLNTVRIRFPEYPVEYCLHKPPFTVNYTDLLQIVPGIFCHLKYIK